MKGKEIEKVPHCIIRFYHNLWYKDDKSPQLSHKLIQTGELEMRENLYNEKIQKIEYNHTSFPEYMCYDTLKYKNV